MTQIVVHGVQLVASAVGKKPLKHVSHMQDSGVMPSELALLQSATPPVRQFNVLCNPFKGVTTNRIRRADSRFRSSKNRRDTACMHNSLLSGRRTLHSSKIPGYLQYYHNVWFMESSPQTSGTDAIGDVEASAALHTFATVRDGAVAGHCVAVAECACKNHNE